MHDVNSAHSAQKGNEYHFGHYEPSHDAWKQRWGWDYKKPWSKFESVKQNYKDTLIHDFYYHDISKGPFKNYDLGEY